MTRPHLHPHEQRILRALIDNLGVAGFKPAAVYTGDGYVMPTTNGIGEVAKGDEPTILGRAMTADEVLQVFEDYDMYAPTVHFTDKDALVWGRGVQVVPGNRQDFISDWHTGDKEFGAIVEEVGDNADEGVYE